MLSDFEDDNAQSRKLVNQDELGKRFEGGNHPSSHLTPRGTLVTVLGCYFLDILTDFF